MVGLQHYQESISQAIKAIQLDAEPAKLYDPIRYILDLGGKRIRPSLALIGADLFEGDPKEAMKVATSIELFHNFTLIHDDIMDKAPLRRGKPTVQTKWNNNVAILSGDAMLIKAYELLASCQPNKLSNLFKVFNRTAFQVCEGQQYDMDFENLEDVKMDQYLKMIEYKTSVLLGAGLQMGAIVSNAPEEQCELLYDFGVNLGMAFQLKDDWLDVYGDPEKFGKKPGGDIIASKKTYLMIKSMELASQDVNSELKELLSLQRPEEYDLKVKSVMHIYEQLGVGNLLLDKMNDYYARALKLAAQIEGKPEVKSNLLKLSKALMEREV